MVGKGDADTGRQEDFRPADEEGFRHVGHQLVGDDSGVFRRIEAGEQDDEFVASQPR